MLTSGSDYGFNSDFIAPPTKMLEMLRSVSCSAEWDANDGHTSEGFRPSSASPHPYVVIATDSQYHCPFLSEDEKDLTSSLKRMTDTESHYILGTIPGTKLVLRKPQSLPFSGNAEDGCKYTSKEAENCSKFQHPCAGDRGQPSTLDCAQNSSRNSKE